MQTVMRLQFVQDGAHKRAAPRVIKASTAKQSARRPHQQSYAVDELSQEERNELAALLEAELARY